MATTMTISTPIAGNTLTSQIASSNDTATQEVLVNFAYATGANDQMPPQQLLDHVMAQLAEYMLGIAREKKVQRDSAVIRAAVLEEVHW